MKRLLHIARSNRQDPLLSVWRYGLGRVAAFTASPHDDAENWPGWDGYARFWSDLSYWTARRESDNDVSVRAVRRTDSTEIIAETFGRSDGESILSQADSSSTTTSPSTPISLRTKTGLYRADIRDAAVRPVSHWSCCRRSSSGTLA